MPSKTTPALGSLVIAAIVAACGTCSPAIASAPDAREAFKTADALSHADALLKKGETVRARAMLVELTSGTRAAALSDAERTRAFELLNTAKLRLRQLDPMEVALQRAELGVLTDDLIDADQQAMTVLGDPDASEAMRTRAQGVIQLTAMRRATLAGTASQDVDRAVALFNEGRYAEAKAILKRVSSAGITLDPARQRLVSTYSEQIVDLEQAEGRAFQTPIAMGLFAPGDGEAASSWLLDQPDQSRTGSYMVEELDNAALASAGTSAGTVSYETSSYTNTAYQPSDNPDVRVEDLGTYTPPPAAQPVQTTAPAPTYTSQPSDSDVIGAARRFEASSLLGEANMAFEERRLSEALTKYTRVINEYGAYLPAGDLEFARQRRSEVQVQLNTQGGPSGDPIDTTVVDRELERQRVTTTFDNHMQQADAALNTGDVRTARDRVQQARLELTRGRDVLAQPDFESRMDRVERKISEINEREEELRITEAEQSADILARETAEAEAARAQQRDQKINEALHRVHELQVELKYDEALEVVDQILFLDPNNPAGLLLQDVIQDTIIYREYYDIQERKARGFTHQNIENQEAMIAPRELMGYPEDWPAISFRRGSPLDLTETPADRSAMAALGQDTGPVLYDDNFLVDVLANVSTRSGVDVDVDWNSLQDVGVDQETPVSLRLANSNWSTVLDRVLEKVSDPDAPASWSVQDGILTIASDDVLRLKTVLNIYDINDLLFEVPYFDNAPEFDLNTVLQSGSGGGGQSPFSGGNTQADDRENREERIQQIVDLVQASVDADGWVDFGGTNGTIQELNGQLIITQTPRAHREIIGLLDRLRQVRALQINVEARFLLVNESFFEQIGFDLDLYFNPNNEFGINRIVDPSVDLSDYFDAETGRLVSNVSGGAFAIDTDGDGILDTPLTQPVFAPGVQGDQFSVIGSQQNSFGITSGLITTGSSFAADVLAGNPALGITGRFLDDIQVDFLLEATQADQRTVQLTAPRLTFLNGQRAFIAVATQQTFVSDLTPIVSDAATAFDPVITPISSGVVLDVEGVVSSDRRYVTLTVLSSISEFEFDADRNINFTGVAGGTGGSQGGNEVAEGFVQVPVTQATTINTTVTVPDQGTVMLGGQRVVDEIEVESGVPVLSKIPILNRFFSNRAEAKEERTLMVLIKPTIIIQDEEEEKNFPGLLDQLGG